MSNDFYMSLITLIHRSIGTGAGHKRTKKNTDLYFIFTFTAVYRTCPGAYDFASLVSLSRLCRLALSLQTFCESGCRMSDSGCRPVPVSSVSQYIHSTCCPDIIHRYLWRTRGSIKVTCEHFSLTSDGVRHDGRVITILRTLIHLIQKIYETSGCIRRIIYKL